MGFTITTGLSYMLKGADGPQNHLGYSSQQLRKDSPLGRVMFDPPPPESPQPTAPWWDYLKPELDKSSDKNQ
ncbi:hypothetical protein HYFRA_00003665 [Hymenoscyphus fraxineus]|uniref:Uncharacterized protein n=1 Tax=Hymenoscyphus fraxineus TaxID=746836 RepID=A0A9N9PUK2_9HELO|nr:hypothetical protein HYFRA_00003665 [Hymenoscyphus fraxineus]